MGYDIFHNVRNVPKRYYVVLLIFVSDLLKSYSGGSPNLVIADITTNEKIIHENETEIMPAEINRTSTDRGIAVHAQAIGTIFAVFSGIVVHEVGGATFLAIGMLGVGILTTLDPFMIRIHVYLFTLVRFVFGIFEGFTFIGNIDVLARWIPQAERVRALTVTYLGYGFGDAINIPLTAFMIQHVGWSNVFYISGAIILIWCFLWITFVTNDPSEDKFISREERDYLSTEMNYISKDKTKIPYRDIFTSLPVYVLLNEFFVAHFTQSFLKSLPLYVKDSYGADIRVIGLISGIPQFTSLIIQPIFAYFVDYMRSSGYSISKLHKWFLFCGQSSTVLFFFLSAISNNVIGCVVCITLAKIFFGLSQVSYSAIVIDIAGQYAGFLQSLTLVVKSAAMFLNRLVIGLLIQNHTQFEWSTYFLFISFLTMYGVIVFLVFGSGELQSWSTVFPQEIIKDDIRS